MNSFNYDFDTVHNRRIVGDIKYQPVPEVADVIPMWIADMDFKVPPAVQSALISCAEHGIFGYTETDKTYDQLIISWYKKRINWSINSEWIFKVPGVMFDIAAAIRVLTKECEKIMICQPVYYPFRCSTQNG